MKFIINATPRPGYEDPPPTPADLASLAKDMQQAIAGADQSGCLDYEVIA